VQSKVERLKENARRRRGYAAGSTKVYLGADSQERVQRGKSSEQLSEGADHGPWQLPPPTVTKGLIYPLCLINNTVKFTPQDELLLRSGTL
jgi:hypothetical protein